MDWLMAFNDTIQKFEFTAYGGFALYFLLCVVVGTAWIMKVLIWDSIFAIKNKFFSKDKKEEFKIK